VDVYFMVSKLLEPVEALRDLPEVVQGQSFQGDCLLLTEQVVQALDESTGELLAAAGVVGEAAQVEVSQLGAAGQHLGQVVVALLEFVYLRIGQY